MHSYITQAAAAMDMQLFRTQPSKKRSIHSQIRLLLNTRLGSPSAGVSQFVKFLTTELKTL